MVRWPARYLNPDFSIRQAEIQAERRRMRAGPRALERPVIVLAGWRSPKLQGFGLVDKLAPLTSGRAEDFIRIAYPWAGSFEHAVDRSWSILKSRLGARPAGHDFETSGDGSSGEPVEVDVIGISMGGLIARIIAAGGGIVGPSSAAGSNPRIKVRRLFTIATPHGGARLADWIAPDRAARLMRRDSELLRALDRELPAAAYQMICYAQLRDWWVGARRTAPPGYDLHWIDARTPVDDVFSHFTSPRRWPIVIDIARRLRGESPLAGRASVPPRD